MALAAWVELIDLVLQFPGELLALARVLRTTPETQRQNMIASVQADSETMAKTGRPVWGP